METLKGSAVKKALWTAVENAGGTVSGWKAAPHLGGFEGRSGGRFSFVVNGEDVADRAFQDKVKQAVTRVLTGWAPKGDHVAAAVASAVWGPPKNDGLTLVVQLPGGVQLEDRAMTMSNMLEAFDMQKEAKALYLKGWDEHPRPDGKRMAYGKTFKLGPVDVAVRIIQENDAGTAWRVDRKGLPTWEAMFEGKAFKSEAAAGQAVAGWWTGIEKAYAAAQKDGYSAKDAAYRALEKGARTEATLRAPLSALLEMVEARVDEARFYSLANGMQPVESTIAIHPKRVYFLDVHMGPSLVITTKVDDQYVTYIQPPSRAERRMERELFGSMAQKGTEKFLARSKELEDQYGIKEGAHLRASLKDLLAGGKGLPADPRDYEKVTVTVVPVPGADWSGVRNNDPWYAAEEYGGVGGLKVDGQDAYEISYMDRGTLLDLKKDKRFKILKVVDEKRD